MSSVMFQVLLFSFIAFSWTMYLMQELFVSGSSALNRAASKDEGERRQIQVATGIHWDGIEVWLIASLTLTFAVFPLAFTTTLTYLYVPFYLLVFALIGRGVAIEVIYKMDSESFVKKMVLMWTISSVLIVFILGVYLSNLFLGFRMDENGIQGGFLSIFNVTGISGGLLFLSLSLIGGSAWIRLTTEGDVGVRAMAFVKRIGIIYTAPIFLLLVFMGFNNTDASIFIGELFSKSPLFFVLPGVTVLSAILATWFSYKDKALLVFIFALATMGFFVITGFVGIFPNLVPSRLDPNYSVAIILNDSTLGLDPSISVKTMNIVFVALCIFYPIVIGYQVWKYVTFTKKVKYNDQ